MRILVAPDKFKGTLSATAVAEVMAGVLRKRYPRAEIVTVPLTDGGDGFVEILTRATGGKIFRARTTNAAGRPCLARWGVLGSGQESIHEWAPREGTRPTTALLADSCRPRPPTRRSPPAAVLGISEASGLDRLPQFLRCAGRASTVGTGWLIAKAVAAGYRKLIIGLGGSATNDGGIGLVAPLGFQFLDRQGKSIPLNGFGLARLHRIVPPGEGLRHGVAALLRSAGEQGTENYRRLTEPPLHRTAPLQQLAWLEVLAATDVTNPLYGREGAARQFARQKGATTAEIERLDKNLRHLARIVERCFGFSPHNEPGAGAAGGCGYGLMAFLNARRVSGFEVYAGSVGLEREIRSADLVITGEGHLDRTSAFGKGCFALAQLARKHRKPVWAVCGQITGATNDWPFTRAVSLVSSTVSAEQSLRSPRRYLRAALEKLVEGVGRRGSGL